MPVRALSIAFLVLLGLAVGATSQITGVLLVFALLVTPAATAQALTARPALSLALTVALGLLVVWLGPGHRLLLGVPGRVLHHDDLVRDLPVRARSLAVGPPGEGRDRSSRLPICPPPEGVIA